MTAPINVVLVHRDRLCREALAFALGQEPDILVARVAGHATELADDDGRFDPSLFVLSFDAPEREGLAQARWISSRWPLTPILMTGVAEVDADILACCESGACGYLVEDSSLGSLIEHVRAVASGETPCSPRIAALLFARLRERTRELRSLQLGAPVRLTRREMEIIPLIDQGYSNKEIAVRLGIEVQTVKNHVHNLLQKLEVRERAAAVRYARERGLLAPVLAQVDGRSRSAPPS